MDRTEVQFIHFFCLIHSLDMPRLPFSDVTPVVCGDAHSCGLKSGGAAQEVVAVLADRAARICR